MKDLGNKSVMAANLGRLMEERNISAKEMSRILNFPYTTVLSWLKGDNYPRIDKIDAMADYFGVLKSDLIEEKKEEPAVYSGLSKKKLDFFEKVKQMPDEEFDRLEQILQLVENTK